MRILNCILLIDDDPASLFITKKVIRNLMISQEVESVGNGCEGKDFVDDYFKKFNKHPDLIFLDINMPVCDGFEFMTFINEKYPTLVNSVVILTTSSHPRDEEKMKELGIKHYISKPITLEKLSKFLAADSHIPFTI